MALTVVASGTLTLSATTETDVSTQTPGAPTTYVWMFDFGAFAAGEVCLIRIYMVLLASPNNVERLAYPASFIAGVDDDLMQISVPIPVDSGASITTRGTLQRKNGSSRAVPWKIFSL